jgi:hypothetical protein
MPVFAYLGGPYLAQTCGCLDIRGRLTKTSRAGRARRPSPAVAVAFIALLAALSGTAVASPGKNRVDSSDIKNNSVGSKDLRANNVATKDVKNNNLRSNDIRNNTLTG